VPRALVENVKNFNEGSSYSTCARPWWRHSFINMLACDHKQQHWAAACRPSAGAAGLDVTGCHLLLVERSPVNMTWRHCKLCWK